MEITSLGLEKTFLRAHIEGDSDGSKNGWYIYEVLEIDEILIISGTYGTWKETNEIREMALAVLGEDASQEIIVYCGVGGYASPVGFALTQMIGYTNVKLYDGSMQEWSADPRAQVIKYRYQ